MAASVYSRRPPLWNNLLSITTTQKSVQVIFGTIYTAQNNHLYIATKDHILTVPNILPNLIYNQYLIYLLKIFLNHKKYSQKIYVYQLKYLNEWKLNKEKLSHTNPNFQSTKFIKFFRSYRLSKSCWWVPQTL